MRCSMTLLALALACMGGCIQFARSEATKDAGADAGADAAGDTAGDLPLRDYAGEFDPAVNFRPHHYCDDGRGPVECCHRLECPNDVAPMCDRGVCVEDCGSGTDCCLGLECHDSARPYCNQNVCGEECVPECDGRECGSGVNCGGPTACGACPASLECRAGRCQPPVLE